MLVLIISTVHNQAGVFDDRYQYTSSERGLAAGITYYYHYAMNARSNPDPDDSSIYYGIYFDLSEIWSNVTNIKVLNFTVSVSQEENELHVNKHDRVYNSNPSKKQNPHGGTTIGRPLEELNSALSVGIYKVEVISSISINIHEKLAYFFTNHSSWSFNVDENLHPISLSPNFVEPKQKSDENSLSMTILTFFNLIIIIRLGLFRYKY